MAGLFTDIPNIDPNDIPGIIGWLTGTPPQVGTPPGADAALLTALNAGNFQVGNAFRALAPQATWETQDYENSNAAAQAAAGAAAGAAAAEQQAYATASQNAQEQAAHDTADVDRLLGYSKADQAQALQRLAQERGWTQHDYDTAVQRLAQMEQYAAEDFATNKAELERKGIYNLEDYIGALEQINRQAGYAGADYGTAIQRLHEDVQNKTGDITRADLRSQEDTQRSVGRTLEDLGAKLGDIAHRQPLETRALREANNRVGLLQSGRGREAEAELERRFGLETSQAQQSAGRTLEDSLTARQRFDEDNNLIARQRLAQQAGRTAEDLGTNYGRQTSSYQTAQELAQRQMERNQEQLGTAGQALQTGYTRTQAGQANQRQDLSTNFGKAIAGLTNRETDVNTTATRTGENLGSQKESIALALKGQLASNSAQSAAAGARAAAARANAALDIARNTTDYHRALGGLLEKGFGAFSDAIGGAAGPGGAVPDWIQRMADQPGQGVVPGSGDTGFLKGLAPSPLVTIGGDTYADRARRAAGLLA